MAIRALHYGYYCGQDGLPKDHVKARAWATRGAALHDPKLMRDYAELLFNKVGGEKNESLAMVYFTRAAEAGCVRAMWNLARALNDMDARSQAVYWLKKGAASLESAIDAKDCKEKLRSWGVALPEDEASEGELPDIRDDEDEL